MDRYGCSTVVSCHRCRDSSECARSTSFEVWKLELEVATLGFDDHRSSALCSCSPSGYEFSSGSSYTHSEQSPHDLADYLAALLSYCRRYFNIRHDASPSGNKYGVESMWTARHQPRVPPVTPVFEYIAPELSITRDGAVDVLYVFTSIRVTRGSPGSRTTGDPPKTTRAAMASALAPWGGGRGHDAHRFLSEARSKRTHRGPRYMSTIGR